MGHSSIKVLQLRVAGPDAVATSAVTYRHFADLDPALAEGRDDELPVRIETSLIVIRRRADAAPIPASAPFESEIEENATPVWREIVRRTRLDPSALWRLGRAVRQIRPDIVHAFDWEGHLLALVLEPLYGFKLVATAPETTGDSWKERIASSVDHKLLPGFHRVIASNQALAQQLRDLGCSSGRVDVISEGVDTEHFRRDGPSEDLRATYGISHQARVVGLPIRMVRDEGLQVALQAIRAVQSRFGPMHVLLFDAPVDRQPWQPLVDRLGLTARAHLADSVPDRRAIYAAANATVAIGVRAGLPTPLLESLSMETPVVCSRFARVDEVIESGRTGIVVAEEDPRLIASAITTLLGSPRQAETMASAGRLLVCQRFRREHHLEQVAESYRRVMKD